MSQAKAARMRPVKPIPAERIEQGSPWRLERFSSREARAADALNAEVLEQMREALRPQLEAELEALRQQVREAAEKKGYEAGYAAGLEAARKDAETELAQKRAELEAGFHQVAEPLLEQLTHPLQAWEPVLVEAMSQVMAAALKRFLAEDAQARAKLFSQVLAQQLADWQARSTPITVTVSSEDHVWAEQLLQQYPDVTLQQDDTLSPGQVQMRQAHSLTVLDWSSAIEAFSSALDEALNHHETSTDKQADSTSEPA